MKPLQYMDSYDCPAEATLDVIGGKWKGIILYHLLDRTMRFNEIRRLMPKITQRTLTNQLRELERDGVLQRTIYAEVPPRVEYSITELGMTLSPIVLLLNQWGETHMQNVLSNRYSTRK
jgi:DNA-binding HxlR family transcriptional regulator